MEKCGHHHPHPVVVVEVVVGVVPVAGRTTVSGFCPTAYRQSLPVGSRLPSTAVQGKRLLTVHGLPITDLLPAAQQPSHFGDHGRRVLVLAGVEPMPAFRQAQVEAQFGQGDVCFL